MSFYWYGTWKPLAVYEAGSVVEYEGSIFRAKAATSCLTPGVLTSNQCKTWEYVCTYDEVDWNTPGGPLRAAYEASHFTETDQVPVFRGPQSSAGRAYPVQDQREVELARRMALVQRDHDHDQQLLKAIGIPPAEVRAYDSDVNYVRYDPAAAEKATLHPPNCLCPPCQLHQYKETVQQQWQRIRELESQKRQLLDEHKDLWKLAQTAIAGEEQARRNTDRVAKNAREAREVPAVAELRVGDAERNRFIEHLGNMFSDGHLSQEEFSERSDKANEAKTMEDLRPLVADLPSMVAVSSRAVAVKERTPFLERRLPVPVTMGIVSFAAFMFLFLMLGWL